MIISAWDVVAVDVMPDAWLRQEMPLLVQYLQSNVDSFEHRIEVFQRKVGI